MLERSTTARVSVDLYVAAFGVQHARYRDISNAFLKILLLSGMPWCYEDPNIAEQLIDILLNVFDGTSGNLSSGSCGVSPITTTNNHIMHQLASMDKRYVVACIQQYNKIVNIIITNSEHASLSCSFHRYHQGSVHDSHNVRF